MGKKKKAQQADAPLVVTPVDVTPVDEAPPEPPPPPSDAALSLHELPAQVLGAFFELVFPDRRLLELCRELHITTPGYRLDKQPPENIARILADEYLAAVDVRAPLETAVRETLRAPAFESTPLNGADLVHLLDLMVTGDVYQQLARVAWKALLLGDKDIAAAAIDDGIQLLAGPLQEKKPRKNDEKSLQAAIEQAERAEKKALERIERAEKDAQSAREQLAQARAETAARDQKLADVRSEAEELRTQLDRARADLLRVEGAARAMNDARRLQDEVRALSDRLARETQAREDAEQRAEAAEKRAAQQPKQIVQAPVAEDELPTDEEASSFLVPVLTREFYDSIERWDRRMQRAALDKIHKLASDWRHGSLRAIPLEGVPGYYRIRVATDVRLIYRREGNQLEILSLIDREDLDRYVRQARTR